jgi:hypothetical protein
MALVMSGKEEHRERLEQLLTGHIERLETEWLKEHLASRSDLPGPRGNIELAAAFADLAAELSAERGEEMWSLAVALSGVTAEEAPVNDPREIIAFTGAVAVGSIGAARSDRSADAFLRLREMSRDPRWRTREGVAMGLQRLLAADMAAGLAELGKWISGEDWLAMRAVAAGVAEPPLLIDQRAALGALDLHKRIIDRVLASGDRTSESFRTLRKGLGYSFSVVVGACPEDGFVYLEELAATSDKDVRWIVRENLKKKRLAGRFPREVERVLALMA